MRFQFRNEIIPVKDGEIHELALLGAAGWEAVSVIPSQAQVQTPNGPQVIPALMVFMQKAIEDEVIQTAEQPDEAITLHPEGIKMEPEQGELGGADYQA